MPTDTVDKSVLQDAIEACRDLREKDYTEDSWSALEAALEAAVTAMNSEETTEAEAAVLAEALNAAREALETAPVELPIVPDDAEVSAVGIGTTSLTLMWDAVDNADSYKVYVTADGGERTEAGTAADTWLRVDGLTPGTDYTFEVYAVNNAGESEDAMTTEASTLPAADTEAPSKVEGIRVLGGDAEGEVRILWNPSTDESGDAVSYIIYINGEKKAETDQTEYVLEGAAEGEVYQVRLVAVDANGNKSLASSFHFTLDDVEGPAEPVSKKTLEYFLNKAKGYVEDGTVDGLVESIQKMFADAIAKGETVMADEDATREEVLDAAKDLMTAIHALEMKAADKTDLEMALELSEMIDLTKYVEAGQAEFLAAKEAAEGVLADGDAMQAETDEAWNNLVEAMNALRLKADKSVLEDLINHAEDLDLTGYTEESASVFRAALAAANDILADKTLSVDDQTKVDEAVSALQAAYDGLEKAQGGEENPGGGDTDDTQKPGSGQSGDDSQNAGNNGNTGNGTGNGSQNSASADKAAKTGDTAPIAAVGMMLVLSAGAALLAVKKKGKR